MIVILISAVAIILVVALWNHVTKKHSDLPPGPWNLPLLGSLLWLDPKAPHLSLAKMSKKFGPIFSVQLGTIYTVVIADAKLLRKVLIKEASTGRAPLYLFDVFAKGKGMAFVDGNLWKEQRRFATSFLKSVGASKVSSNKQHLHCLVTKSVDDFIQYVKAKGDRAVINPSEVLVHNVGSVSSSLFLGKFWERDDQIWKNLLYKLNEGAKIAGFAGPVNFLPFLRFLPQYKKFVHLVCDLYDTLHTTHKEIIDQNKTSLEKGDPPSLNLIDAFLTENPKTEYQYMYTEDQLSALITDLFSAGVETTTNSVIWILLYLAEFKDIQKKLRQELLELGNRTTTIDDLSNLPMLEATIAEVARIRTPLPLGVPHSALEDINVEGFRIPKGAMIMPLLWGIHMDPKFWRDPECFLPERFLDESGRFRKPESFTPFETGKRMCIGEELARTIVFLFVSNVLLNFEINSSVESEIDLTACCGLTLSPKPQNLVFVKI